MSHRLTVHLGRDGPKSVELDTSTLEVTEGFSVVVENHGPPQHIHIAPAAELARFVTVTEPNHFIGTGDAQSLPIEVARERPDKFDGQLRIVTGYGSEETLVDVKLRQPGSAHEVVVDESLGQPDSEPSEPPSITEVILGPGTAPLVALATVAILLALGAILLVTEAAIILGALAVLVGVGIAILLLVR